MKHDEYYIPSSAAMINSEPMNRLQLSPLKPKVHQIPLHGIITYNFASKMDLFKSNGIFPLKMQIIIIIIIIGPKYKNAMNAIK